MKKVKCSCCGLETNKQPAGNICHSCGGGYMKEVKMKKGDILEFPELFIGRCPITYIDEKHVGIKVFLPTGAVIIYVDKNEIVIREKLRMEYGNQKSNHFYLFRVASLPKKTKLKNPGVFYGQ